MELSKILSNLKNKKIIGNCNSEITAITQDSRKAVKGSIYAALKGSKIDGNDFIPHAVKNGASAVLTEKEIEISNDVCQIVVPDARKALGEIVSTFYDNPSEKLTLVGITGTNGKTTTTYILESILRVAGKKAGLIGTISYKTGKEECESNFTTPEAEKFQQLLSDMVDSGLQYAAIEVSSHAIEQKRVWGTKFDVAVFTNLTHDHLDYHGDLETYSDIKLKLFTEYLKENGTAVINADDHWAEKFIKCGAEKIITYGFSRGSNIIAFNISPRNDGTMMSILTPKGMLECYVKLFGIHNVYNIMAAVGAAVALDISLEDIDEGLKQVKPVPGRFEYIEGGQLFPVVVDYAHTPDSLRNVMETIKCMFRGKLITVFGATGDRDKTTRPEMGKIASDLSDYIIITSDDPHSEDPEIIADEIIAGIPENKKDKIEKIVDREQAIKKAIEMASPEHFILIAGKGHEKKQIFKDKEIEFNDKEIALKYLKDKKPNFNDLKSMNEIIDKEKVCNKKQEI